MLVVADFPVFNRSVISWFGSMRAGVKFLQANLHKMEDDDAAHMPIGFEIVFPAMLDDAKALGLDLPYHAPIVQQISAEREKKMKK
jgi:ent-copalyl diphosphate synthase